VVSLLPVSLPVTVCSSIHQPLTQHHHRQNPIAFANPIVHTYVVAVLRRPLGAWANTTPEELLPYTLLLLLLSLWRPRA
jgi:hypothetical protein